MNPPGHRGNVGQVRLRSALSEGERTASGASTRRSSAVWACVSAKHGNNLVQLVRDALQTLLVGFRGHRNTRKSNDIISVDDIIHAMVVTATGSCYSPSASLS
jgi:hypothetical protein